jgi:nitrite reductase/ring-hydroxylating ferredoxin subunit
MYLSCDETVRSLRPAVRDGAAVAVIGGEGHPMGAPAATAERWDILERWTARHFGDAEVTHRWATHDLVPTDRIPLIGLLTPRASRRWVATGFAKWGMTNGYVSAKLITEELEGRRVPWFHAFDATRIMPMLNRELVSIGKTATTHLLVDRISRRPEPRCTHQGCVLREDRALGTWDCPCHGSRFDAEGRVVQGPATTALELD